MSTSQFYGWFSFNTARTAHAVYSTDEDIAEHALCGAYGDWDDPDDKPKCPKCTKRLKAIDTDTSIPEIKMGNHDER